MKGSLEWMEATYDAEFASPLFDLPRHNTELLESLYRHIHPRFPLRMTDLQAFVGNAYSDVSVRVTMFGGQGSIEVTAERLSTRFNGMKQEQDLAVCNQCTALAEQALQEVFPNIGIATFGGRSTQSIRLGDGSVPPHDFLRQVVKPGIDLELAGLGDTVLTPCVNLEVRNDSEAWRAILHAYDNVVEPPSVVVSCWMAGSRASGVRGLHEEHIGRRLRLLEARLRALNIETPSDPADSEKP